MAADSFDVVIVGGGMAGCATAYQLSLLAPHLRGAVVERGSLGHNAGGSFGESRMYRLMHSDPYFTRMQQQALPLWRQLEKSSGQRLLRQHGLLFFGESDTGETVEGSIPGAADVMRQLGMPHELLGSHAALNKRWPLKTRPGTVGLWDPQAGSVLAAAALNAMQETARQRGWTFVEGQAVRSVQCSTGAGSGSGRSAEPPVAISLDSGRTLAAQRLVLSAGAWTSDMLALLGRRMDLEVWSMVWGHYAMDPAVSGSIPMWYAFSKPSEQYQALEAGHVSATSSDSNGISSRSSPCAVGAKSRPESSSALHSASSPGAAAADACEARADGPGAGKPSLPAAELDLDGWEGGLYYGFPPEDPSRPVVKVGIDFAPPVPALRPTSMRGFSSQPHPRMAALLHRFLTAHWRGFQAPLDLQCSPYCMTRDLSFVLGALPDLPQVLLFAGDCGRAFKFAPLIGRCLAELALGLPPSFDIEPLSPARPAVGYGKVPRVDNCAGRKGTSAEAGAARSKL